MTFKNKIGCILSKKIIEISKNPFLQKNVEQREGEIYKDISNFKICRHVYNTLFNSVSDNFFLNWFLHVPIQEFNRLWANQNVFWIKKANCIFEELAYLYLIVLLTSFFPLLLRITQKKEPNRRNYLFELQNHAEHNKRNIQTAPYYSSATAIMLAIFWTERDFWIISDYRNSFNNKLKNL